MIGRTWDRQIATYSSQPDGPLKGAGGCDPCGAVWAHFCVLGPSLRSPCGVLGVTWVPGGIILGVCVPKMLQKSKVLKTCFQDLAFSDLLHVLGAPFGHTLSVLHLLLDYVVIFDTCFVCPSALSEGASGLTSFVGNSSPCPWYVLHVLTACANLLQQTTYIHIYMYICTYVHIRSLPTELGGSVKFVMLAS